MMSKKITTIYTKDFLISLLFFLFIHIFIFIISSNLYITKKELQNNFHYFVALEFIVLNFED